MSLKLSVRKMEPRGLGVSKEVLKCDLDFGLILIISYIVFLVFHGLLLEY